MERRHCSGDGATTRKWGKGDGSFREDFKIVPKIHKKTKNRWQPKFDLVLKKKVVAKHKNRRRRLLFFIKKFRCSLQRKISVRAFFGMSSQKDLSSQKVFKTPKSADTLNPAKYSQKDFSSATAKYSQPTTAQPIDGAILDHRRSTLDHRIVRT